MVRTEGKSKLKHPSLSSREERVELIPHAQRPRLEIVALSFFSCVCCS